jgi:hypothetical protein
MARKGGGVLASTLEDWPVRSMEESVEAEMRGRVAIVKFDILRI